MRIRMLDAATIGRIAAGEVVERPVSVAKELIENALDAGSTNITIEIRDGGNTYLRVTDNGSGIAPEDVRMAFENHATSKFSSDGDLSDIPTLGFRGEALPSIAAVSKLSMETCRKGAEMGVMIKLQAGRVEEFSECALREGTTVTMRDLFCNLPARRAFLKRAALEAGAVTELVTRFMLGNPCVSFRLINNHKTTYQTYGDGDMRHAALNVLGREVAEKLIAVDEMEGGLRACGWIGVGECARSTRSQQCFFINGRLVRCALLSDALEEASREHVMIGLHPICALQMTLPPQSVDVNVHPNKLEVRFKDELAVRQTAVALLKRALHTGGMLNLRELEKSQKLPDVAPPKPLIAFESTLPTEVFSEQTKVYIKPTEVKQKPTEVSTQERIAQSKIEQLRYNMPDRQTVHLTLQENAPDVMSGWSDDMPDDAPDAELVPAESEELPFRVLGVAFSTYVMLEYREWLLLIDQHAAHERILYEKYTRDLDRERVSQMLLTPVVVSASPSEIESLIDNQTMLQELGYEIEPFGETAIQVRAIPQLFGKVELTPLVLALLSHLHTLRSATTERRRKDIVLFACKRAVKAGDSLTSEEIAALIAEMLKSPAPPTCPHGRPVIQKMTRRDMERLFRRV